MNILILDDFPREAMKIKNALGRGEIAPFFKIESVETTKDFFKKVKEAHGMYDFFILDILLETYEDKSQDMDGIKVAEKLKKMKKVKCPFIFLTNDYDNEAYNERLKKLNIPLSRIVSKASIDNKESFRAKLIEVYEHHFSNSNEQLLRLGAFLRRRKIGFLENGEYKFLSPESIMFLRTYERNKTIIHFIDQPPLVVAAHMGYVGTKLLQNYPNILRFGKSHFINIECIETIDGLRNDPCFIRFPQLPSHLANTIKEHLEESIEEILIIIETKKEKEEEKRKISDEIRKEVTGRVKEYFDRKIKVTNSILDQLDKFHLLIRVI